MGQSQWLRLRAHPHSYSLMLTVRLAAFFSSWDTRACLALGEKIFLGAGRGTLLPSCEGKPGWVLLLGKVRGSPVHL